MASSVTSWQRSLKILGSSLYSQRPQHSQRPQRSLYSQRLSYPQRAQHLLLHFSSAMFALGLLAVLSGSSLAWAQPDIFSLARASSAAQLQSALAAGAFADEQDIFYMTPLMLAAKYNPDPGVIRNLASAGVSLNRQAINGKTALIYAAEHSSSPAVILALLDAGANSLLRDHRGLRASDYAAANPALASHNIAMQLEQRSSRPQSSDQVSRAPERARVVIADVAMPRPPEAVFFQGQSPVSLRDVRQVGRSRRWFE